MKFTKKQTNIILQSELKVLTPISCIQIFHIPGPVDLKKLSIRFGRNANSRSNPLGGRYPVSYTTEPGRFDVLFAETRVFNVEDRMSVGSHQAKAQRMMASNFDGWFVGEIQVARGASVFDLRSPAVTEALGKRPFMCDQREYLKVSQPFFAAIQAMAPAHIGGLMRPSFREPEVAVLELYENIAQYVSFNAHHGCDFAPFTTWIERLANAVRYEDASVKYAGAFGGGFLVP
jgi:hypothetical protein